MFGSKMNKSKPRPKSLSHRLEMVEQELAAIEEKERLANCICGSIVTIGRGMEAEFREEMSRPCPVHGFRELWIIQVEDVEPARDFSSPARVIENPEVNVLLEEYERRLAESRRAA